MNNRFNLIDEPWIPIADHRRVSLRQVFSEPQHRCLSGNPVQKIALLKLLLAIAQAAVTPEDETAWKALGPQELSQCCLGYLEHWHNRFYLYGGRPFLQMPAIAAAKIQPFGAVLPEVSTGNTTVLSQIQQQRPLEDTDKALLLITLMGFALSGKKTDNRVVLSPGYTGKRNDKGKPSTGKPGPAMAYIGLLHHFLLGSDLKTTLWLNLLTQDQIKQMNIYPNGVGRPPWEAMPKGEDCPQAACLKQSLMGRLVPLCRFCLLADQGLHYSEGIAHLGYKEGVVDPQIAKSKAKRNGDLTLGFAIALCYQKTQDSYQAKARLRRLLVCVEVAEVCRVLRPLLTLIDSRVSQPLDYARLLKQLHTFYFDGARIKTQWAQEFYSQPSQIAHGESVA